MIILQLGQKTEALYLGLLETLVLSADRGADMTNQCVCVCELSHTHAVRHVLTQYCLIHVLLLRQMLRSSAPGPQGPPYSAVSLSSDLLSEIWSFYTI